MTACLVKRRPAQGAFRLMAAGLFGVLPLVAQAAEPIRPAPYDPETMELAEPVSPGRTSAFEVQTLKAPSAESVGVLDAGKGGLSAALWNGTSANVVRRLLPALPANQSARSLRDLERRLLLTSATAPEGADGSQKPSLVEMRAERLLAMGDAEGVTALTAMAPGAVGGAGLDRIKLDTLLLSGDAKGACAEAGRAAPADQAKLQVFCNLAAGNVLQGNLGLDLLRERNDPDQGFVAAAEILAGLPPLPADKIKLERVEPLHVAMFWAAKLPLPAKALSEASPLVARAVALSPASQPDQRLSAAERAESLGILSTEALRGIYLDASFAPDELAAPLARAEAAGPRARALLFRAATSQPDPVIRATFVAKALELAAAKNQVPDAARAFAGFTATMRPDPRLLAQATLFARAHYALGQPVAAAAWLELARSTPETSKNADRIWPLAALYGAVPGQEVSTQGLAAWRAAQEGQPAPVQARRNAVVLGALAALGARVPDSAWLDSLSLTASGPRPALFALMQSAALDARQGLTVLTVLNALGDAPLENADPLTLSESISALTVVGLGEEARRLALEALLANGV